MNVIRSVGLFVAAGLAEIGGGYLIWRWLREGASRPAGLAGSGIWVVYGVIPTFQPSADFGRVYAAYGGVFVIMSLLWGWSVDGHRPDNYDCRGAEDRADTRRMITSTSRPPDPADPRDPADPLGLAADAPLLAAWLDWMRRAKAGQLTPMTTPGHKQRLDLVGTVVAGDAPLYGALDSIKHADQLRADAEARAAALWGADWCRFSVAGSTHGNQALCLAIGQPGQEVIITRTLHRSLLLGLVMAGLRPVWVRPDIDPVSGLPAAIAVRTVRDALAAHPDACGVLLGDPSY